METHPDDATRREGLVVAHALERLMGEFITDMRERSGLYVCVQRDPGGRIVSYGYHLHEPNAAGACDNLVVYGYPTPLAALSAGLKAKCGDGRSAAPTDRLVMRCELKDEGGRMKDEPLHAASAHPSPQAMGNARPPA
jgi:hypothetical protein